MKIRARYKIARLNDGKQQGFTLIEILVTLTIISILAMLAIPMYLDYRTRAKVGSEIALMDPVKQRIYEQFVNNGSWPASNGAALLQDRSAYHGNYLQSVEVSDNPFPGSMILTYNTSNLPALGDSNTIIFYPVVNETDHSVRWSCDLGSIQDEFRPKQCRH